MTTRLIVITGTLIASLFYLPAMAQPAPDMGPGLTATPESANAPVARPRPARDCSTARNIAACNERRAERSKIMDACKEMRGPQRQQCMHEQLQKTDCSKQPNPQHCAARKQAALACQGQSGPTFRQCMQEKMPPVDCSKSRNPARCEQRQKARVTCQDKQGPEHKACLREQFKPR